MGSSPTALTSNIKDLVGIFGHFVAVKILRSLILPSEMTLTYRLTSEEPPIYRISFDGIEVGSISKRRQHIHEHDFWHWGVGIMPLRDHGGRPPSGDAWSFEAALQAFKVAFLRWHAGVPADLWKENRDYIAIPADQWKRE